MGRRLPVDEACIERSCAVWFPRLLGAGERRFPPFPAPPPDDAPLWDTRMALFACLPEANNRQGDHECQTITDP